MAGRRLLHPSRTRVESLRSTNLATSQLASSIQFQVCDHLSFTDKFKFVITASPPESLRSRVLGTSVSSSLSPLVERRFQVRYRLSPRGKVSQMLFLQFYVCFARFARFLTQILFSTAESSSLRDPHGISTEKTSVTL